MIGFGRIFLFYFIFWGWTFPLRCAYCNSMTPPSIVQSTLESVYAVAQTTPSRMAQVYIYALAVRALDKHGIDVQMPVIYQKMAEDAERVIENFNDKITAEERQTAIEILGICALVNDKFTEGYFQD